jgi:eukaryotic-like serine/threonine-protein kinase
VERERARFPLVWKLFSLTALLILLVVAIAVAITIERANAIARSTVNDSIASAAKLFKVFEKNRLEKLALGVQQLGKDTAFHAYIEKALEGAEPVPPLPATPAPPSGTPATSSAAASAAPLESPGPAAIDYASILDSLLERKEILHSDLLILLDDQGRLVARTDQPSISGGSAQDLYEEIPLVKQIVDNAAIDTVSGVVLLDRKLYHAAIAPLNVGAVNVRIAYLINAYAIDDAFANSIAESTKAGVVFVPAVGNSIARSSNAPSFSTMQQMAGAAQVLKSGKVVAPSNVRIERSSYVMTAEPLMSKDQTVGAAVFLRSLDRELAPFKQIETALLVGGGIALLLAFILSWMIARRLTRPIEDLAAVAQSITSGDYTVSSSAVGRKDEIGILGRSFAKMVTALRDKAELEELYEQMAARSAEREAAIQVKPTEEARFDEGTVLVTDLRGLPATVGSRDAREVIAIVEHAMQIQETEVLRQDGSVREIVGHHLVSIFRGDRSIIHAIRAARAISEELALQSPDPKAPMTVGVGIATGEFVTGSVSLSQESGLAIIGNAPLLALLFAWQAPTGSAYISYETAQAAGGEVLSGSTREEVRLKWLAQPLPVASLPLQSLTTGVMKSIGKTTGSASTVRLDASTSPGATAPGGGAVADLTPGAIFAQRYKIEQVLGRGGMGVVYRATDQQLDETVAIKTLPGDVMSRSPEDLERFKREIRLARKITHRNVLRTFDYGEAEGVYFISMEFVRGYTLSELLEESQQMVPRVAMGIARQICRGLQAAHEQGIIHRDIKPQNVLIDHKGEVKLMDFGIARMAEAPEAMTQAGLIVGTPHYMSPEQVQGKPLDPRSDVYSMGVMLYEILVGRRPFESPSLMSVLTAHITEKITPPIEIRPEIGREINAILMRCLAKDPRERYADAGQLLAALDQLQVGAAAA